jgi:hypothetical protein
MFQPRSLQELASEWPKELDHISASSVKMIARCPEQWRMRYLEGRKSPPAAALIAGRADHAAIEKSMRQKITSYVDLPTPDVVDEFVHQFETEVDYVGISEMEVKHQGETVKGKRAKTKVLDSLKVEAGDLVAVYHDDISPTVQPIAVEEEFSFEAPNLPVRVDGRIDLVAGAPPRTDPMEQIPGVWTPTEYMIDRKRSATAKKNPDPEWRIQAEVYQLVRQIPHAWHLSAYKTGQVDTRLWQEPRNRQIMETSLEHLCAEIGYFYMRYGPEGPWPARGKMHPWACSYCGFFDACWAWR